ncbi:MAG: VCBS repeat-containing protein, partial [Saprospiraceae bacterium]|nr:VCBS repeat-containing protein [Saprospiraceae bacterium]
MDVITGDGYGGIDLMENNNGSFTGDLETLLPGYGTYGLRFVDVNNDGYSDIIRLYHNGSGSSFVMVCLKDKNNKLITSTNIATVNYSNSLTLTDINGDGLMDISILEDDNNRLLWLFNRGDGSFADAFVADDKVALASTGDVYGDYHEYFFSNQNNELNLTLAVDAILYISLPTSSIERAPFPKKMKNVIRTILHLFWMMTLNHLNYWLWILMTLPAITTFIHRIPVGWT